MAVAWELLGLGGAVFIAVISSVIVFSWAIKPKMKCPGCNNKNLIPRDSPKGKEVIEKYNLRNWVELDE
jgi:hypothetical protein